jgi:hypothetical protein
MLRHQCRSKLGCHEQLLDCGLVGGLEMMEMPFWRESMKVQG